MTDPSQRQHSTPYPRAIAAQAVMELRLLIRSGESLVVTVLIPLGILVFFSMVDVLPTGDRRAVDFLVPGVLTISVTATGLVAVAIQTAFERKYGVLKRLGGTPLPRWGFLLAKGLAVGAILLLQCGAVVAIAIAWLDWQPSGGGLTLPLGVLAGAITMTALGLLMAGSLRAEGTLAASNTLFLVLITISGVTFDAQVLPSAMAAVGGFLPVGALGEFLRSGADGEGFAWQALALVVGWGVAGALLAARTFRWEP